MRTLLIYPEFPKTFWSYEKILELVNRKVLLPPLGMVTVAALLPQQWPMKLVDRNVREVTEAPDLNHHRGAAAPNLIHSLDSSLLHLTFCDEEAPFTLIHDCLLMRSCDMDRISGKIRKTFAQMYSKPVLRDWAGQLGVPFDESVMVNTLDIQESLDSPYLFC